MQCHIKLVKQGLFPATATERNMRMNKVIVFAILLASAAAAQAQSVPADQPRRETVPYSDLNIASKAGAEVMKNRIMAASRTVCGLEPAIRELKARAWYEKCVSGSAAQAMADLHIALQRTENEKAQQTTLQR
jgi:UrcA family protein